MYNLLTFLKQLKTVIKSQLERNLNMKPILETGRLMLIPFETIDLELLYQTLNEPFIREYLMDDEIIPMERQKNSF